MTHHTDAHRTAQVLHDLGSAVWFGGSVMGVAGVNKSGEDLTNDIDKIRVASSAWSRYAPVQWAGVVATLAAGTRLTATSKKRLTLQRGYATTGTAKAVVTVAGAAATGFAAFSGKKVADAAEAAHRRGEQLAVRDASISTERTPDELATWQRRQRVAQYAVPVLSGANIVLNALIVQSFRPLSTTRAVLGRVRPD